MYRYAVVNRETLRYMPCFCGCVNAGHGSNFDCYVRRSTLTDACASTQ